jgi:hypothetical protein
VLAYAQPNAHQRPTLFDQLPASIHCTGDQLQSILQAPTGSFVDIPLAPSFAVKGIVASNRVKYQQLQTVAVRLANYQNIVLSISVRRNEQNEVIYTGRIISPAYADGFEIKRIKGNDYQLVKIETEQVLPTCADH